MPLWHAINKVEMETVITTKLGPEAMNAREDLITAFCSDTCIARFDHRLRTYLLTDFSKLEFGYDICQPDVDHVGSGNCAQENPVGVLL